MGKVYILVCGIWSGFWLVEYDWDRFRALERKRFSWTDVGSRKVGEARKGSVQSVDVISG